MFARLTGTVVEIDTGTLVLDVHGVGYLVSVSGRTLQTLEVGQGPVSLRIETHYREDQIQLFGFLNGVEHACFKMLHGVQGVGGKVALNLLAALSPDELRNAILVQDKTTLCRADGVGPKLAARLLTELKDKAANLPTDFAMPEVGQTAPASTPKPQSAPTAPKPANSGGEGAASSANMQQQAISALTNLGYSRTEAAMAVAAAARVDGVGELDALIREGLKELASTG